MAQQRDYQDVNDLVRHLCHPDASRPAVFVIGAGASLPYPIAADIKKRLLASALEICNPREGDSHDFQRLKMSVEPDGLLDHDYLTLEALLFLCQYALNPPGSTESYFDPEQVIGAFLTGLATSPGNFAVAYLRQQGRVGPVLTSNFDDLLYKTLTALDAPYRLLTERQFDHKPVSPTDEDILAFHGTLAQPSSAQPTTRHSSPYASPHTLLARGLMRPFAPPIRAYLEQLLGSSCDRDIVFYGYRGADVYDFNHVLSGVQTQVNLGNLHWISIDGSDENLSPFALQLGCQYYKGDFAKAVLDTLPPATYEPFGIRPARHRSANGYEIDYAPPTEMNLFREHEEDPKFRSRALDFLRYLQSGFTGAWAVTEHYSLESYGFSQNEIEELGGISGKPVFFYGLDVRQYLAAQKEYWKHNSRAREKVVMLAGDKRKSCEEIIAEAFPGVWQQLEQLLDKTTAKFKKLVDDPSSSLPAERAMHAVLSAIALDYQGLMFNIIREAHVDDIACRASEKAVQLFEKAIEETSKAAGILRRPEASDAHALRDMVPYLTWDIIARENLARALLDTDFAKKLQALKYCVYRRRDLVDTAANGGLYEEALYLRPQIVLRCTEAIKLIYQCSRQGELPRLHQDADTSAAEELLEVARHQLEQYEKASALPNHRFVTLFDCEIMHSLHAEAVGKIEGHVKDLIRRLPQKWREIDRFKRFVAGLQARLQAAAGHYRNQSISNVLKLFD